MGRFEYTNRTLHFHILLSVNAFAPLRTQNIKYLVQKYVIWNMPYISFFSLPFSSSHTRARAHSHTRKETADQIFIRLSGLWLWLGPFTAAGSLLMMRGSCSPVGEMEHKQKDQPADWHKHTQNPIAHTDTPVQGALLLLCSISLCPSVCRNLSSGKAGVCVCFFVFFVYFFSDQRVRSN